MNNIVLYQPEIPQNTGNIMRTCVATNTKLHLIKPLGFVIDDAHLRRSGVNYIFGKESTGIPKEILKDDLNHCMRIPMTDKVRALNVSNSVAIVIYEALRQQDYNDLLREEPLDESHKGADYLERD